MNCSGPWVMVPCNLATLMPSEIAMGGFPCYVRLLSLEGNFAKRFWLWQDVG